MENRRILAIFLALVLILSAAPYSAVAEDTAEDAAVTDDYLRTSGEVDNIYNKILFYFDSEEYTVIDNMSELEEVTNMLSGSGGEASVYSLTNTGVDEVQVTVQFASDFMETEEYIAFSQERSELETMEEVHAFRSRLNAFSKEYHDQIIRDNMELLSELEYTEADVIDYSPFVVLNMDADAVNAEVLVSVAESVCVANISVGQEAVAFTEDAADEDITWDDSLVAINASGIVSNGTYTGEGVRIGIYEAGGICDVEHDNLVDKDITVRDTSILAKDHATYVTSILSAIAPAAEYYVSDVFEVGVSWFIEKGCDVVNCSFGYGATLLANNTYSAARSYDYSVDGVYDYQIRTHFITVVKSAGNYYDNPKDSRHNPEYRITTPGYAYNVITVGGVVPTSATTPDVLEHASYACYVSAVPIVKPNISATSTVYIPNVGINGGTSYAAPQVAGCIALLFDMNPSFCGYPERVMALITVTAQKTQDYNANVGEFNNKVGAGVIDLMKMLLNGQQYISTYNTSGTANSEICNEYINLEDGEQIQVSLAWLVYAVNTSTTGTSISEVCVTDYDLRIYDTNDEVVAMSDLIQTNVEMLRFTAEGTGTYRIVIFQTSAKDSDNAGDRISLAYRYC